MNNSHILIVEDDADWLEIYCDYLKNEPYKIDTARTIHQAFTLLEKTTYAVVITDLKMIGFDNNFGGFSVLEKVRVINSWTQVIVITAFGTQEIAFKASQQGAFDIVYKPPDPKRLVMSLNGAIQASHILEKRYHNKQQALLESNDFPVNNREKPPTQSGLFGITGNSKQMQKTFEKISYALHANLPVFIFGETGTGKNLIARAIHNNSEYSNRPFSSVSVDDLLQHWEPVKRNLGRLNGGTFFLDKLHKCPIDLSPILSELLSLSQKANVRLISTMTISETIIERIPDILMINPEIFKELANISIYAPPLRLRKDGDDIPALAGFFIHSITGPRTPAPQISLSEKALQDLVEYDYPIGNVRELSDIIQKAVDMLGTDGTILPEHLSIPTQTKIVNSSKLGNPAQSVYILIIGINQYDFLNTLSKAAQDAKDIHNLFSHNLSIKNKLHLLLDKEATKINILNEFAWLANSSTENDKVIIFFSGHGAQIESASKEEFICPVDGNFSHPMSTLISSKELTLALNAIQSKQLICIFDACHAGGVGDIKKSGQFIKSGISKSTYNLLSQGQGRVILASCLPDEVSWEIGLFNNGLFTHYLLEGLSGKAARNDGEIWLSNLFGYISEQVPKHKPQHPYLKSETQDFIILTSMKSENSNSSNMKTEIEIDYSNNLPKIRDLVNLSFSDEELIRFCHDYFQPVYDYFSTGMSKAMKIEYLLGFCERKLEFKKLLRHIEKTNPNQYALFQDKVAKS